MYSQIRITAKVIVNSKWLIFYMSIKALMGYEAHETI